MKKKFITMAVLATFSISSLASGINSPEANASASQGQGQAQGQIQGQAQGQMQGQGQSSYNANNNRNSSHSSSAAVAGSYSGGNKMGQEQSGTITNETNIRPAAGAPAISLTSVGTDNCLGSAGGSIGTGFISIGGATTTESTECNRRAYSRALRDLGLKDAAIALLCKNDEVASVTPACTKQAPVSTASAPVATVVAGGKSRDYDALVCARNGSRCN